MAEKISPNLRLKYLKVLAEEIPGDTALPWQFTRWLSKAIGETTLADLASKMERARQRLAKVEINKNEQQKLKIEGIVEELHREGKSYRQIADELNRRRYRTARGKLFSATQVLRIIKRS